MLLVNDTPLPAALVPNAETSRVVALLVVAATYRVGDAGLVVDEEQLPLALVCPPPEMGDGYITKEGTSVCVTGHVYAPEERAPRAVARLRVGDVERAVAAFGPRVWREGMGGHLTATPPLPFERVAMTWSNAYGGSVRRPTTVQKRRNGEEALMPEHDEAYGLNLDGVGFYPERALAIDQPLPQLEDPEHLIERWDDRPEPVCFAPYPMHGGLRAQTTLRDGKVDYARHGRVVTRSAPRTTFAEIPPGTPLSLAGMRPGGSGSVLAFDVPEPPVVATVRVGPRGRRLDLYVDAIDLDAQERRVRIAYRAVFAYELFQYEERLARLEATPQFSAMVVAAPR